MFRRRLTPGPWGASLGLPPSQTGETFDLKHWYLRQAHTQSLFLSDFWSADLCWRAAPKTSWIWGALR